MFKTIKTQLENVFTESKSAPSSGTLPPQVDTPEKAQSFFDSLQTTKKKIENSSGTSPQRKLVHQQLEAAKEAIAYHAALARFNLATLKFEADSKQIKEAIATTKAIVSSAEKALQIATKKHADLETRLAPLTNKLIAESAEAQESVNEAQRVFDIALASGDEAAEVAASEALALAKKYGQPQSLTGSPIEIRVTALTKELAESEIQRGNAEKSLASAIDNALEAEANLSKLHYDKKVFDLACLVANHEAAFGGIYSKFELRIDTHATVLQVNVPDRFMNGNKGSYLNLERLASSTARPSSEKIIRNLDVFSKSIDDLPEEFEEKEAPELLTTIQV